jgi:hypothetical protein
MRWGNNQGGEIIAECDGAIINGGRLLPYNNQGVRFLDYCRMRWGNNLPPLIIAFYAPFPSSSFLRAIFKKLKWIFRTIPKHKEKRND